MANVVDSLIVTLGIDTSKFTKGQKEASAALKKTNDESTRTAKEMEFRGKQAGQFFAGIKTQVLGLAAAFLTTRGATSFVEKITSSDAAVGRLSKNLDMSTESLSAWEGAAKKLGSSGEDIDGAFRNINKIVQDVKLFGNSDALIPLARAGVDIAKFLDKTTTAEERMRMLADAMSKLSAANAQTFGRQAGFSEDTVNVMMQGTAALDKMVTAQKALNVVTQKDADAAIARQKAWSELTDRMQSHGRVILTEINPALMTMATWTDHIIEGWGKILNGDLANRLFGNHSGASVSGKITHPKTIHIPGRLPGELTGFPNSPRGIRNNNPGNLNYAGQSGAHLESGANARFAAFNSMEQGISALATQLQLYASRGIDTVRGIISKYAPKGENNTEAYIKTIMKKLGVGDNQRLNLNDQNVLRELISGISTVENGAGKISIAQINAGLALNSSRRHGGGNSSTTEVKIAEINVQTQATDANGIAKTIGPAVENYAFASQANSGLF